MNNTDAQEYKWEMEVYMEMWQLCFTPCTFCIDLDLRERRCSL